MTNSEEARISITEEAGVVTVTGGGMLNFFDAQAFGEGLKRASLNADSVVADLRQADFIDTKIVQDLGKSAVTLLGRQKRLKVLVSSTAYPLRVLRISRYEEIMDIVTTGAVE